MEQLIADLVKFTCLNWKNDSHFSLEYHCDTQSVISNEFIRAGECLGELYGEPKYIWDVQHNEYMFVDEDMVIDVSKMIPRTVLTLIRDENLTENESNCEIIVYQDEMIRETRFFIYTTTDIFRGQEVVYSIPQRR